MRLGEIKKIISQVLNDKYTIEIKHEAIFSGQAYLVNNYVEIVEALNFLENQKWNDVDFSQINQIKESKKLKNPTQLNQDEFNQFNSCVNSINQKLPFYYSILETMVTEQKDVAINIKLPKGKVNSLTSLSKLNNKIEKILKLFNIDGQFEFIEFDKGSEWYVVAPVGGFLSYKFLIYCLKIAQEYLKSKQEYFKSKRAEFDFKASLKNEEKFTENKLIEYSERRLQLVVEDGIDEAIKNLGSGSKTKPELNSQLINATQKLIKELDEGTEFHLSLNPPNYAKEQNGLLEIDYKKLQNIRIKELDEEKKQKQLKSPGKKDDK